MPSHYTDLFPVQGRLGATPPATLAATPASNLSAINGALPAPTLSAADRTPTAPAPLDVSKGVAGQGGISTFEYFMRLLNRGTEAVQIKKSETPAPAPAPAPATALAQPAQPSLLTAFEQGLVEQAKGPQPFLNSLFGSGIDRRGESFGVPPAPARRESLLGPIGPAEPSREELQRRRNTGILGVRG
jgi:hypothetical protein